METEGRTKHKAAGAIQVLGAAGTGFAVQQNPVAGLLQAFLSGRSRKTLEAYRADMEGFRAFVGADTLDAAVQVLIGQGLGHGNAVALAYRAHLLDKGLAPATVNRRLAALRSLVKLARVLGMVPWTLEVEGVKSKAYRNTKGPGADGFRQVLGQLEARQDGKGTRDRAMLRLLYDMALRRGEVVGLDVEDVNLDAGTVAVLGKGKTEKVQLTLPERTKAALAAWMQARGTDAGPLFTNYDRAGKGSRLTGAGLYSIVRQLGQAVGLQVRPHGLRHASITAGLDLSGGDVRAVQRFSRHSKLETLIVYDDARRDMAGEIARMVSAGC